MRDAVLHETLPQPGSLIQRRPSPYQYGQAIWAYVGGKWGDDTVARLYKQAARVGPRRAIMDVLGLEQDELFDQFHAALRSAYEPVPDGRQAAGSVAEPLLTSDTTGAAWSGEESVEFTYETDTTQRVPVVSTGVGVRTLVLGSLPLELYYADPHHRPEAGSEFGFRIRAGW